MIPEQPGEGRTCGNRGQGSVRFGEDYEPHVCVPNSTGEASNPSVMARRLGVLLGDRGGTGHQVADLGPAEPRSGTVPGSGPTRPSLVIGFLNWHLPPCCL